MTLAASRTRATATMYVTKTVTNLARRAKMNSWLICSISVMVKVIFLAVMCSPEHLPEGRLSLEGGFARNLVKIYFALKPKSTLVISNFVSIFYSFCYP